MVRLRDSCRVLLVGEVIAGSSAPLRKAKLRGRRIGERKMEGVVATGVGAQAKPIQRHRMMWYVRYV